MTGESALPRNNYDTLQFYEMLFCDNLKLYLDTAADPYAYPWQHFMEFPKKPSRLKEIIADPNLETRIKLLAYHLLRDQGHAIETRELLAVIVEVALQNGIDVLASYQDNKVRLLHHSGRMVFWDKEDEMTKSLIFQLFGQSEEIIKHIGTWDGGRLNPPKPGKARITFLMTDGLYFGEAPSNTLFNDPLAAPALATALAILEHITAGS